MVTHQTGIEEQEEQLLELFLFEAESRISQKKEENYAQKKKCGRCSCNKHSLSTVGSATTDVQGIVHKSGESRRTRAPTAHTHTHYSRRRTRIRWGAEREESLKQPRGNGVSPLKELGLIRPELNSKLSDVQVNQETDHQVDLRAYIYMDTLYFFFFVGHLYVAPPPSFGTIQHKY